MADEPIPVTIVSGPLGAGKTTLLNHLLRTTDRRLAVLVNDMGELNVDAALLEEGAVAADAGIAELSNGCICCELRDDLETEVVRLARSREFEQLVVESSGISEPAPVAQLFTTGSDAAAVYEVDALVTVVDAASFDSLFGDGPVERAETEEGQRSLPDLVVEGIECCDVLLLNKCDRVADDRLHGIEATIRELQPRARLIRTEFCEVDPAELLGTGRFDLDAMRQMTAWKRAREHTVRGEDDTHDDHPHGDGSSHGHRHGHEHGHRHPEEVYGVTSFVYRRRRPFDPERFAALLESLPPSVIRAKGVCWVAGRDEYVLVVSQVGPITRVEATDEWVAAKHEIERELYRENHPELAWDEVVGDRRIELVVIGRGMNHCEVVRSLDDCLFEGTADPDERVDVEASAFPDALDECVEFTRARAEE
ncbi:CobW family GTP-binding protein [Natronorarus salvus]|uniref:CobW family GTP-binding protein n=1 Tax=Natronorarus salvus TaxID=3117733 RepID=UPI002F260E2D